MKKLMYLVALAAMFCAQASAQFSILDSPEDLQKYVERYVKCRFYVVGGYRSGEPKNALPMCVREQERLAGQYVSESSG